LGQGILTFLYRISCLFWSSVCPTVFFSYLGTRNTNFSRSHFFFIYIPNSKKTKQIRSRKGSIPCPRYEKKRSDIPNSKINKKCDREKLVFLGPDMRNNCRTYRTVYFRVRYVRQLFLISATRNTNFSRSHFLSILEFGMSDSYFSYLGQGILIFLDRKMRSRKVSIPWPRYEK
jgi:hypothetical protein